MIPECLADLLLFCRVGQLLEVLKGLERERREEEGAKEREQELAVTSCSTQVSHTEEEEEDSKVELTAAVSSINQTAVYVLGRGQGVWFCDVLISGGITSFSCPLPPQCVGMAAVFKEASIATPGEYFPLIEGEE